MNRPILTCVLLVFASAAMGRAQQASASDPYQGVSNPPADETISASQPEQAKPPAGVPLAAAPVASDQAARPDSAPAPRSASVPGAAVTAGDDDIVHLEPRTTDRGDRSAPALSTRSNAGDPDNDIVHPAPLPPGALDEGVTIRVRLLTSLSTTGSERGEEFRSRVATDVLRDGQVMIPAGAEIDGRVSEVSTGHAGGHGTIRVSPETITLPSGERYHLDAQVAGTPGSNTHVNGEGVIQAGSRYKKDGIEYGSAVGAGAATGAMLGGPVGALTGSVIGAGAITIHLLADHPQARLDRGSVLLLVLTEPLRLGSSVPVSR